MLSRFARQLAAVLLALACIAQNARAVPLPHAAAGKSRSKKAAAPSPAKLRAERLGLGTLRAAGMLLAGRVEPRWLSAVGTSQTPSLLKFPVARGWFVRGFGSGAGGYHQAMDIGGTVGWNVRAAAPGLVGYAGDEVSGYGNLILIIHAGGFITAYGHNSKNRVIAGQRVERGEVIAELGSTGRSKGPHVHFEFLYGGNNCDPAPLFRPDVRRHNGKVVAVPRAVWKTPGKRPKAIKCYPRKHHPGRVPQLELDEPEEDGDDDNAATAVPGSVSSHN